MIAEDYFFSNLFARECLLCFLPPQKWYYGHVCVCIHASAQAVMFQSFLSLVKITFYTYGIIECILKGIILLLLKLVIYVCLCSSCLLCSAFYCNGYNVLFLQGLCEMTKSNTSLVKVQKYNTFFLTFSYVFISVLRKARGPYVKI